MTIDERTVGELREASDDYERAIEVLQVIKKAIEDDGRGNPDGPWKANHLMLSSLLYVCATAMAVELSKEKLLETVGTMHDTLGAAMGLDDVSETIKAMVASKPTNGQ